jgi:hypothetical protein
MKAKFLESKIAIEQKQKEELASQRIRDMEALK